MTDAPLFGLLPCRYISSAEASAIEQVLPPRKQADYLMNIYWHHIHPIEPFLDDERFRRFYRALFEGTSTENTADEPVFVGILNTIFALTTQLQEDKSLDERERTSTRYFQRAWAGVSPHALAWNGRATAWLVQCLLLMGRYLQCTNNPHQMWMAVGLAVRMAQSLGLHIHDSLSTSEMPLAERHFRARLWNSCVYMDRCGAHGQPLRSHLLTSCRIVSWILGRSSTVPLTCPPTTQDPATSIYFVKTVELYEICNHIFLSQAPFQHNEFIENLGLPLLYEGQDQIKNISRLDACLTRWEQSLPPPLVCEDSAAKEDITTYRKAVYLRFRYTSLQFALLTTCPSARANIFKSFAQPNHPVPANAGKVLPNPARAKANIRKQPGRQLCQRLRFHVRRHGAAHGQPDGRVPPSRRLLGRAAAMVV